MVLADTVDNMVNGSYKERFIAEYNQVCIRLLKLENTIKAYDGDGLDFEPDSPKDLLQLQADLMRSYKAILEKRAVYEKITLEEVTL